MSWQPMDTCPTDGTRVLISRNGRVAIGWFDPDKYIKQPKPFWSGTDAQIRGKSWAKQTNPDGWQELPDAIAT